MELPDDGRQWDIRLDTCRIELWRGYMTAGFVARTEDEVLGESSTFKWRSGRGLETEEARLAHYELVRLLKDDGWTRSDDGQEWYETVFAKPVRVLVEPENEPEPEPTEADGAPVVALEPPRMPEPEREPEPAPEPQREPVAAAAAAPPPPRPRRRIDAWQAMALTGLPVALALLVWAAGHQ